jgi:hypothetical protein
LKVQIISSFGVPGSAPFAVGEELDVPKGVATVWIDAGRAVSLETEAVVISEAVVEKAAVPVVKPTPKNKQTR